MALLLLAVPADDVVAISRQPFPFGHILANAINPTGAIAICSLLIVLLALQVLAQLQASSRFVFALARDNAMPFADTIKWTNSSKQPVVANWVVVGLCIPFCLLTIAGRGTLYSVLTVTAGSLSFVGYVRMLRTVVIELMEDHPGDPVPPLGPESAGGKPELVESAAVQVRTCAVTEMKSLKLMAASLAPAWASCTV